MIFFACLVMIVDLISWSCFCFIGAIIGLGIGGVEGLAIDRTVLIEGKIAIGFF